MDTAYFYLTPEGKDLAEKLAAARPGDLYGRENFKEELTRAFGSYDNLVCIMATGIVVRILAPLLVHKTSDPAVVVLDQKGNYAISLLSGHLGGANDLARQMAAVSGGRPVITTATDVAGELSFDSFAKSHDMAIENIQVLKHISGALLRKKPVLVFSDSAFPEFRGNDLLDLRPVSMASQSLSSDQDGDRYAGIVVIHEGKVLEDSGDLPVLYLRPRTICAGIGCKRGMEAGPIREALVQTLQKEGLSPLALQCIATIPLKADEPGIIRTAEEMGAELKIIPTEDIQDLDIASLGIASSEFVAQNTGVPSVSTASAYLASGRGRILVDKAKYKGITVALAQRKDSSD